MAFNKATVMGPVMVGTLIYLYIGFIGSGSGKVQATHFRGGTISWKPSDSYSLTYKEIIFTFKLGWRLSRIGCDEKTITSGALVGEDARWFCMFGCKGVVASTREKCTEFNLGEDWMFGSNTFKYVFESDGLVEISYMECCWLSDMVVGAGGEWALTTTLNLGIRSDTGGPNSSPVTAMAPMITLRAGVPDVIDLAVRDSDGDRIACRLGRHVGECGTICSLFHEFSLDTENCLIRYDPVSNTTGKVPVAIMVEDHHKSNDGITIGKNTFSMTDALSSVPVQFLVILETPPKNCSKKPSIVSSIPASVPVQVRQGHNFTFTVTSTPCDQTSNIEEFILIAPIGVRKSPILVTGDSYTTQITWTPSSDQDGSNLICVRGRSSDGVLSEQICITVNVPKATRFCSVVGGSHFITFDESSYEFHAMCKYQLVGTLPSVGPEQSPFNITLSNEETHATHNGVKIGTVEAQALGHTVTIDSQRNIFLDGFLVNLPIRKKSGLRVETSGRGISIALSLSVRMYIDDATLSVQLPESYAGKVEGLCGNFNADPVDDLTSRGGLTITSEDDFIRSFLISDGTNGCTDEQGEKVIKQNETSCSEENMKNAVEKCAILVEKDGGCFAECHGIVDPKHYHDNCISVLCKAFDDFTALDVLIRAYADVCQREGIPVCDWRSNMGIAMECPPNTHYETCATTVPATCADSISSVSPTPSKSCIEGCICNQGYILSGTVCVPESECGCIINDIYYPKGFTYRTEGCVEECVCGEGCKKVEACNGRAHCERGTDGFYRCIEKHRTSATCKAITDPHYETFDGTKFDSMGTCAYIMVRSKRNSTKSTAFTVVAVNVQSREGYNASQVKEVHVHFGDGYTLTLGRGPRITLNDKDINAGSKIYGVEIRQVGRYVVADFHFGLVIRWDGIDMLRITAWSPLRYMVEGLCGDWDEDPSNDFAVRPTEENLPDGGSFAESWRIEGYGTDGCYDLPGTQNLQPPCEKDESLAQYQEECRGLIDPKGAFESCHALVDPMTAHNNCIYDLCAFRGDQDIKERIFSSYVDDCMAERGSPQGWRDEENMTRTCVNGVFTECMEQCQPTCSDPTAVDCLSKIPNQLGDACVEGCVCQQGFVLSGSDCVPQEECGCVVNGRYETKGFTFAIADCTQTCVCQGPNQLECGATPDGCNLKRDSCQQRQDGYFECVRRPRRRATCKAVTDPHYMTFDRKQFDSMGTCTYIMVRSREGAVDPPFQVVTVNENPWPNRTVSHVKEAYIDVGDDLRIGMLRGGIITINTRVVQAGTKTPDVEIKKVGRFWVATFPFGLYVKWDGQDRLRISAWSVLREKVEGVCGDFDDDETNDFMTPDGELVENITTFVNSWKVKGYDEENDRSCVDPQFDFPLPPCPDTETLASITADCQTISDPASKYAPCHGVVDFEKYIQDCIMDLCASDNVTMYKERVFSEYVDECEKNDVTIDEDWREADNLESFDCPENSHFEGNADQCQPSCTDLDGSICRQSGNLGTETVPSCICDEGYILSGDNCVLPEECGCVAEDGSYFEKGFVYRTNNCSQECECRADGVIACQDVEGCAKGYRCRKDTDGYKRCIKHIRRRATCKAVTDPHYQTFDGVNYDSMGSCAYIMARSKEGTDVTPFRVIAVNEKPTNVKHIVSHVKEVYIEVGDNTTVTLKGPVITINDEVVLPGTIVDGIEIRRVGRFTVAEFPFGLVIRWDNIDRLRVMAWASLKGMMEGLCGDFNDDPDNDFTNPEGEIEPVLNDFVNSWKVEGYGTEGCEDPPEDDTSPCETPEKLEEFKESCRVLIDPTGPLLSCFELKDPNSAFNNCVFDVCAYDGDPTIRERIISSYTEDCREEAVADAAPSPGDLDFRELNETAFICGANSQFKNCIDPCQPTCNDRDGSICRSAASSISAPCVDACECDEGFVLSGINCVPEEMCGCVIDGRYVEPGYTYNNKNCTTQCTCIGDDQVTCVSTPGCEKGFRCRINDEGRRACIPHIRRRATCKAVTDPHYMTFDGKRYDSMGTCAYAMVQSRTDADLEEKFKVIAVNEEPAPGLNVSHVREVHIEVGNNLHVAFLPGPEIQINGDVVLPGSRVRNVIIRKVGRFTVAEFDFGLVVRWDGVDRLRVMAWASLKGKVEGLCGDFDDDPSNDFMTPRGTVEENINRFVRSWRVRDYSPPGCLEPQIPGTLADCDKNFTVDGNCSRLIDPEGPFKACHELLDPGQTYSDCVLDWCNVGSEAAERNIMEFTEDCLEMEANFTEPPDDVPCPENSSASVSMEQCQPTCDDPDASLCKANSSLGEQRVGGCVCNPGLLLGGDRCISPEECGCLIDGKYREKGFKYRNSECDVLCECVGLGDIICLPSDPCRTTERCTKVNERYRCTPHIRNKATCKAITDPHYTTFDARHFDSSGWCAYTMTRNIPESDAPSFEVLVRNDRDTTFKASSRVSSVYVNVGEAFEMEITRGPKSRVRINGMFYYPGSTVQGATIRKVGLFTLVEFPFGLVIRWDHKDRLRVTVWDQLKGKVEGLCGRYNDNADDDFTMPSGEITGNMTEFVSSWAVKDRSEIKCVHLQDEVLTDCTSAETRSAFEDECNVLLDTEGPFQECHKVVDPQPAYRSCVSDMCMMGGDRDYKDRVLTSYVHDCLEFLEAPEPWRLDEGLQLTCGANSKYARCMHQCQPTCSDPDASLCKQKQPYLLGQNCVEGCRCNPGFYLSIDRCVPVSRCGCLVNGIYHEKGFKYRSDNCRRECVCQGQNVFGCTDVPDGCLDTERCKTAHGGYLQCMPGLKRRATCKAITDPHYTTFDGTKFDSQGICSYIMVRSKSDAMVDPFQVVAVNVQPMDDRRVSHVREVHVDFRGHRLSFHRGPVAELDGEVVSSGTRQYGMKVEKSGRFMAAYFDFGLSVRWDGADRLHISAMQELRGQVEGVCGDFNDDRSDDMTHATTGEVLTDPEEFVHSWRVQGFDDACPKAQADFLSELPPVAFECGPDDIMQAEQSCRVLLNPDGVFKNCMRLSDVKTAFDNCMLDMCAYGGVKSIQDRVISDFSEDCREVGGELETNWRKEANLTEVKCPANSHYVSCMSECQPTCIDPYGTDCNFDEMSENCVEGCEADDGYVISGDDYVPVSQCGCMKNGRYHKSGETFYTEGCKTVCECQSGIVTCRMTSCGREEECVINRERKLDCVSIETSTCQAWGSTHVDTFDGRTYDLNTLCGFTLAKREFERGDPSSRAEMFFLSASISRSDDDDRLSELRNVRVRFPSQSVTVVLRPDAQAKVQGKNVYNWKSKDQNALITINRRGTYIVLKAFFGLEIAFSGHHLRVTLPKRFAGKTRGLCGNFNGDGRDDLTLKNGSPNEDVTKFAREFAVPGCSNPDTLPEFSCSDEERAKLADTKKCGAILDVSSEFSECTNNIDSTQMFYDKCIVDVCRAGGSSEVLAQALKTFAHECAAIDKFVCDWRRTYMLQIACPVNSHYVGCTSGCEATCGAGEEECKYQQVEDCVCDEGYIRSNGACVAKAACGGCMINRKMVAKGFSYRLERCGKLCTCAGNDVVECEPAEGCISRAKCGRDDSGFLQCLIRPRNKARCQAFGNGHLVTFDGSRFNTTATCSMVMARSRENATIPKFAVIIDMQPAKNSNLSRVAQVIVTADQLDIVLAGGRTVMVNGRNVALGSVLDSVEIRKIGHDVVVFFGFGMRILWDGQQNIRIEATRPLAGQLEGLCGDFDEDESDDYRTPLGVVESDVSVFVNSWKDEGSFEGCRLEKLRKSPCQGLDGITDFKLFCEAEYKTNAETLAKCNLVEYCLFEMCATSGDKGHVASSVYSFYETCSTEISEDTNEAEEDEDHLEPPVTQCDENSHFNSCMSQCQSTCSDQDASICLLNDDLNDGCVAGCQCDDGFILDGDSCVRPTECGCVGSEGEYYPNEYDSYLEDCGRKCRCDRGNLSCIITKCTPGQFCGYKDDNYGCHWENECMNQNGGCDHICSRNDKKVVCSCRSGYNLTSNGKACEAVASGCTEPQRNYTEWKTNTMQVWIQKLDAYMKAMQDGEESGKPAQVCRSMWTIWFDSDDPEGEGDDESLSRLREHYSGSICDNPVAIEARLANGRDAHATGLYIRTMSPTKGFQCYNFDQREGEKCGDFRVRFLCLEELI